MFGAAIGLTPGIPAPTFKVDERLLGRASVHAVRRQQRRLGASLIRNLNFYNISILQLMVLPQLYFASDFDDLPRLRLAVGFVRPQDDCRPTKYFAGHYTDRDLVKTTGLPPSTLACIAGSHAHSNNVLAINNATLRLSVIGRAPKQKWYMMLYSIRTSLAAHQPRPRPLLISCASQSSRS